MIAKSILSNILLLLILVSLDGCAGALKDAAGPGMDVHASRKPLLAVLPVQNYSATPAPLPRLRDVFVEQLRSQGLRLLADEELDTFMARHRLRHVGGIGRQMAKDFAEEVGADGVIITYLEEYRKKSPPKFSMMARLVTTSASELPTVVWMDGASYAGNEAPGLLGLGLVRDINVLEERAVKRLAASLAGYLAEQPIQEPTQGEEEKGEKREILDSDFRPRIQYRSPALPALKDEEKPTVAILPFLNESERRFAGDLIGLHVLQNIVRGKEDYNVIEPGVVRNVLLANRVVIPYGLSIADDTLLFSQLDTDFLLSGNVVDYTDPGGDNMPSVHFTAYAIARDDNKMVWSSESINKGDEGLHLFGLGRIHTAAELSSLMTEKVVRMLALPEELWNPAEAEFPSYGIQPKLKLPQN